VIEAYNGLKSDLPLVVVGDAPYATEYKAKLRAAASERVIFTGFQFGAAYEELQSNCYLYVQATEVGGTHPALIESMSYGNCVVVNGTPENLEVVADCGESFAKNDFAGLRTVLARLLQDPVAVAQLGSRAKARATAQYSWESVVDRYERLFGELVR
jgi:glycosyltransferase involved in cell wall biosynthesis